MFKKKTTSKTCITANYKITINEKEINQTQFLTENYVYTEAGDKKILFLPEKEKQYLIDTENKQLKELDLSAQMMQMNQLKAMIGELTKDENIEEGIRHITVKNSDESSAKLDIYMQIVEYKGIEQTVFHKFNNCQKNMQMFSLDMKDNEVLMLSDTTFIMNGQEQKTKLELINIETETNDISDIDAYSNYKIVKK